jgi:hypothetical protein
MVPNNSQVSARLKTTFGAHAAGAVVAVEFVEGLLRSGSMPSWQ